jgi:predicted transcriptional regulator
MQLEDLQELGLSNDEAKVYLALLELGSGYVSVIAKQANVHRVVCYKVLENLVAKGLVNQYSKDNIRHFSAEGPKILIRHQKKLLDKAENLVPQLLSLTSDLSYKPKTLIYEGQEGIMNVIEDTLHAEDGILGYTNFAELPQVLPENYLMDYAKQKIKKRIATRMLSPHSLEGLQHLGQCYPQGFHTHLVEVLFVDPENFPFEYQVMIYNNKVAILSLNPKELLGIILESALYARTQRAIFELAWRGAEQLTTPFYKKN